MSICHIMLLYCYAYGPVKKELAIKESRSHLRRHLARTTIPQVYSKLNIDLRKLAIFSSMPSCYAEEEDSETRVQNWREYKYNLDDWLNAWKSGIINASEALNEEFCTFQKCQTQLQLFCTTIVARCSFRVHTSLRSEDLTRANKVWNGQQSSELHQLL